jgi:hypothetical protein
MRVGRAAGRTRIATSTITNLCSSDRHGLPRAAVAPRCLFHTTGDEARRYRSGYRPQHYRRCGTCRAYFGAGNPALGRIEADRTRHGSVEARNALTRMGVGTKGAKMRLRSKRNQRRAAARSSAHSIGSACPRQIGQRHPETPSCLATIGKPAHQQSGPGLQLK